MTKAKRLFHTNAEKLKYQTASDEMNSDSEEKGPKGAATGPRLRQKLKQEKAERLC